jgi:hypothetical protein
MSFERVPARLAQASVLGGVVLALMQGCGGRAGLGSASADADLSGAEAGSGDASGDVAEDTDANTGDAGASAPDGSDAGDAADATVDVTADAAPDADLTVLGNGTVLDGSVSWWPADGIFMTQVIAPALPAQGTLVDMATIAQPDQGDAGVVQFAIYSDDGGFPDSLLASSAVVAVVPGQNQAPATVPPFTIVGGTTYWVGLLALSAENTVHLYQLGADSTDIVFGASSLPAMFPADSFALTTGPTLNLFLLVQY